MTRIFTACACAAACLLVLQAGVVKAQQLRALQGNGTQSSIEALFTPENDIAATLVAAIAQARQDIHVEAYLFTSHKLANALIRAKRRGVAVAIIVDREQLEKGGAPGASELAAAGIAVYVDGEHAAAHNKIIVIDAAGTAPVLVTGSYNFTIAAQTRNPENVLVIRGNRELAAVYRANWEHHREHSARMQ